MPSDRKYPAVGGGLSSFGGVDLASIASECGTPAYVYDLDGMTRTARELRAAFDGVPHVIAYAVKANAAGGVVRALAKEGCGADVVSEAELLVATGCGIEPASIVFSGVAKQDGEIDRAIALGIRAIQMESVEEITRVEARARAAGRKARVSFRVNPSVDLAGVTHANIATGHDAAKFGIRREDLPQAVRLAEASRHLELVGMATHVGSQFTSVDPYLDGAMVLCDAVRGLRDEGGLASLAFLDTGGGFGVDYTRAARSPAASEPPPSPADFVRAVRAEMRARRLDDLVHVIEPGRSLVAPHGALLARVVQPKVTAAARWLMIDAGMNDLMRPALYQAHHAIVPVGGHASRESWVPWRVVGPVCESSDDFGEHLLPSEPAAIVAILDAGAYGYTMANRYNGRQLPPEVFLSGGRVVARTARTAMDRWVEERVAAG
ncbi:MAG TPA: diaminopimelate decarboxylase [Polyangiaceae bacterium]